MHDAHSLAGLRSAVLGLSLVLFTAGLEGRVVFHGGGRRRWCKLCIVFGSTHELKLETRLSFK